MTIAEPDAPIASGEPHGDATISIAPPLGIGRMYAIAFDLDTDTLQRAYGTPSWRHAYAEIRAILADEGFAWQQGSVNFGRPDRVDAVACVLAIQRLTRELPWFAASARDVRMLRIEENNDLRPAIDATAG